MSLQEDFFGFSKLQIKTLWALSALALITTGFWIIKDYSSETADSEGLTIFVGGEDQSYKPTFIIDLNHSPVDSLELIPGIGPVYSTRIVAYRDSTGGFDFVDDVVKVQGIGPTLLQKIKPYLKVTP